MLTLKINQGSKFEHLKKPMFSLFDEFIFLIELDNETEYLGHDFQWAIFEKNRLLRIIVPFFGAKKKKAFVISCAFILDLTSVVQYVDNVIR